MDVGRLGGLLERKHGVAFWSLHAGSVAPGGVLITLFALFFRRSLAPTVTPEAAA